MNDLLLYGVGSALTAEFEESCRHAGRSIVAWIGNRPGDVYCSNRDKLLTTDEITDEHKKVPFLAPLFQPSNRSVAVKEALQKGLSPAQALIDPRAMISNSISIGAGSFINAAVVIGAESRIGKHVVINRSASIGHHAEIADYVSLGPGALLAGQVRIGEGAMLGVGCIVVPKITIGARAIVGAGSVVTKDVPDGASVFGNPARIMKSGN